MLVYWTFGFLAMPALTTDKTHFNVLQSKYRRSKGVFKLNVEED